MKKCSRCERSLSLESFHKNRRTVDGLQNCCKECKQECNVIWRKNHPLNYQKTHRDWRLGNRDKRLAQDQRYRAKNPDKIRARSRTNHRIRDRHIARPDLCAECGVDDYPIHGHHPDHNKPDCIVWLCADCHKLVHNMGLGGRR